MGRKKTHGNLPSFKELIIPTINALIELGGSGTVEEINTKVYEIAKLKEETLQIPHGEDGSLTEIDYRLSWSRTYLKKYGLLENSSRGVWALSKSDIDIKKLDYEGIVKSVREGNKYVQTNDENTESQDDKIQNEIIEEVKNPEEWKESLLNILYNITPSAFERLAQRLLRESGFFQVEVNGKSGEGGIVGKGSVRGSGLLSF
ncbi:MAG: winged helix-turn-helix domain-containing protein, partial [Candidatus Kapaibacterium sp.]